MKQTNSQKTEWVSDRSDSDSLKWKHLSRSDVLPMWVADMDVHCAEPILQALCKRIQHGIFGYGVAGEQTNQAVVQWLKDRHQWQIDPEWLVWTPGLVPALNVICRAFAETDDEILTFTPIYPPFLEAPILSHRKRLTCPLQNTDGFYTIDFEKLESAVVKHTKVLLLCSPHNPVGRVWEKETLLRLADFCRQRNILICSDEIHCDLVLDPAIKHIPTAAISPEIADNTITLMSPAKTFNIPGLNCGFVIIPNADLRKTYKQAARGIVPHVNVLGYAACRSAFTECGPWLSQLLDDLRRNHQFVLDAVNQIDGLSMAPVQATYLAWINVQQLNLPHPAAFFRKSGLKLLDGAAFGQPGFVRLNFACSQENLLLAVERIKTAVASMK